MTAKIQSPMRMRWRFLLAVSVLAIWLSVLAHQTGSVIVDGFQSLGAMADSSSPGSLHWPMVGSFMGYDQTWGFHWIGWPLLRSLLLPLLEWQPLIELCILTVLWTASSWMVMTLTNRAETPRLKIWAGLLTVIAPGFLVAAQSYRPEIPTALFLLIALRYWQSGEKKQQAMRAVALFVLPLLHPLGFIVPASWFGWDLLWNWRDQGFFRAIKELLWKAWPLCLGVVAFVAWFGVQPEAWAQFHLNVKSQRLLVEGMNTGWSTFFRWGLGSRGALPLILLLLGALVSSALLVFPFLKKKCAGTCDVPIWYAAVGFAVALFFNIAAKNPNSLHLVAVLPMAVILYVDGMDRVARIITPLLVPLAMTLTVVLFCVHPIKLTYQLYQNNGRSYRGAFIASLEQLPETRKVLIPVAFWEAALQQRDKRSIVYEFSTFPNILERDKRRRYETEVMRNVQKGDLLIWDPLQEQGGVFNFVETTALRHVLINPKDETAWEKVSEIRLPVQYSLSQAIEFKVYRRN